MIFELSKREWISLSEEAELLHLYLALEKFRFEDKVNIQFTIDQKISQDDVFLPPLLMQPIIENAFKHGLLHKEEGGQLIIRIQSHHHEMLKCTIEDNGVGRAQAKLFSKWKSQEQQESSGLSMTQKRLAIINKQNDNLKITDLRDKDGAPYGVRVEMFVKIKARKWDNE